MRHSRHRGARVPRQPRPADQGVAGRGAAARAGHAAARPLSATTGRPAAGADAARADAGRRRRARRGRATLPLRAARGIVAPASRTARTRPRHLPPQPAPRLPQQPQDRSRQPGGQRQDPGRRAAARHGTGARRPCHGRRMAGAAARAARRGTRPAARHRRQGRVPVLPDTRADRSRVRHDLARAIRLEPRARARDRRRIAPHYAVSAPAARPPGRPLLAGAAAAARPACLAQHTGLSHRAGSCAARDPPRRQGGTDRAAGRPRRAVNAGDAAHPAAPARRLAIRRRRGGGRLCATFRRQRRRHPAGPALLRRGSGRTARHRQRRGERPAGAPVRSRAQSDRACRAGMARNPGAGEAAAGGEGVAVRARRA